MGRHRLHSLHLAAVLAFAFGAAIPGFGAQSGPASTAPAADPCTIAAEITEVQPTRGGLLIQTTGPAEARIVGTTSFTEKGLAGFAMLTIELPNVSLGAVTARAEWTGGLFSSMRAVRYRTAAECGVRIRLQPVVLADWKVVRQPDGIVITPYAVATERTQGRRSRIAEATSGSLYAGASHSLTVLDDDDTISFTQLQLGIAQHLGRFGLFRGFISGYSPRQSTGAPYGAVSLSGLMIGRTATHLAAGDLSVGMGETGIAASTFVNTLLIRGAGTALFPPGGASLQVFGGRAGSPTLSRIPGTVSRVTQEISHDKLYGAQIGWNNPLQNWGVGVGVIRSEPVDEEGWLNTFLSGEGRVHRASGRLIFERSKVEHEAEGGFAVTAEPHVLTERFMVGGYYRYVSSRFQPPAAASFFAGLRRSYSLFASARPRDRLTASASLSQTKTFSVFDRPEIGTLSSTRGGALSYQLTATASLAAEYAESEVSTEAGALLPADSFTARRSISSTARIAETQAALRLSRETTTNRLGSQLNLQSNRVDVDLSHPLRDEWGEIFSRLRYSDSRRPSGDRAGSNYAASLGLRLPARQLFGWRSEAGYSETPAGVAGRRTRQAFATIGVQSGPAVRIFQGNAQLTYERFYIEGERTRDAAGFSINASKLVDWGVRPAPAPPFFTRAMPLLDRSLLESVPSRLVVFTFEDRNGNGVRDSGEPAVADIALRIDGVAFSTDDEGLAETRVAAGRSIVAVERPTTSDYIAVAPSQTVVVPPIGVASVDVPLLGAGRIGGRVRLEGTAVDASVLAGIRVTLRGPNVDREAVTDETGAFRFGVLPAGTYTTTLDTASLATATLLAGPPSQMSELRKGERADALFAIRRATARERLMGTAAPPTEVQVTTQPEPPPVRNAAEERAPSIETAVSLARAQQYQDAVAAFALLLPFRETEANARYEYAVVLYEVGRYGDAKRELAAVLPMIEMSPEVVRYRAKIESAIEWTPLVLPGVVVP